MKIPLPLDFTVNYAEFPLVFAPTRIGSQTHCGEFGARMNTPMINHWLFSAFVI